MTPTLSVMARTGNSQSRPDCSTVGDILSWNVVSVMCKQMLGTMKKKLYTQLWSQLLVLLHLTIVLPRKTVSRDV